MACVYCLAELLLWDFQKHIVFSKLISQSKPSSYWDTRQNSVIEIGFILQPPLSACNTKTEKQILPLSFQSSMVHSEYMLIYYQNMALKQHNRLHMTAYVQFFIWIKKYSSFLKFWRILPVRIRDCLRQLGSLNSRQRSVKEQW